MKSTDKNKHKVEISFTEVRKVKAVVEFESNDPSAFCKRMCSKRNSGELASMEGYLGMEVEKETIYFPNEEKGSVWIKRHTADGTKRYNNMVKFRKPKNPNWKD